MPRRRVTASNVPPGTVRTIQASGRLRRKPGMAIPDGDAEVNWHLARWTRRGSAPIAVRYRAIRRACQSRVSPKIAMRGRPASTRRSTRSAEVGIAQVPVDPAGPEALAAVHGGDDDLRRTEQHGIDGIEIAIETAEDLREWPSMITGIVGGKLLGERFGILGRSGDEQPHPSAIDDGVVGAAERLQEIGMGRRKGSGGHAVGDALERKLDRMRLVEGDLERAGNDLNAAGLAARRRIE